MPWYEVTVSKTLVQTGTICVMANSPSAAVGKVARAIERRKITPESRRVQWNCPEYEPETLEAVEGAEQVEK